MFVNIHFKVYNVNNNCATGSSALFLAKQLVAGGLSDCVLALGFEKMQKGNSFFYDAHLHILVRKPVLRVL